MAPPAKQGQIKKYSFVKGAFNTYQEKVGDVAHLPIRRDDPDHYEVADSAY